MAPARSLARARHWSWASYAGNVRMQRDGYMGIVYTANHAAQLDNHRNNTLLKAKG